MRGRGSSVVAALAVLPAGADARHGKPRAQFRPGKARTLVGWARPVLRPATVTPVATPTATPAPTGPAPAPTPAATATATPAPPTVPTGNPHSVAVRSTEFRFGLSQPAVDAGEVKVSFDNSSAEDPHALAYRGPTAAEFDRVDPGAVVRYTVTLAAGSYTLYCPLPAHEGLGMKATLTVR